MIIVNLKGGTGNQLFQYALGRHLAHKNNDSLKLDIDGLERANITGDIYRPFTLGELNVSQEMVTEAEVASIKNPYGIFSKAWRFLAFKLSRDKNTTFHPAVLKKTGDIYLDGFWQSPRYFDAIREILLSEFTLKAPFSPHAAVFAEQIQSTVAVSLHIRRGDYASNPRLATEFGRCSTEYYQKAIATIKAAVPTATFFVFSDDIAWVKQNLPIGEGAVYVAGAGITSVEELLLMSLCQHNIIANSSFSWWGAWLNQNPTKMVIAPTPWFDKQPYDKDLLPSTWIQLPK